MKTSHLEYASFGRRLGALLLDVIILNLITTPLAYAVFGAEYFTSPDEVRGPAAFIVTWVLPTAITIGCWMTLAATPGKLLLGLRVVNAETGERLTFVQCVLRYLGYIVSALPLLAGYLWMLRSTRRQTWHDLLAKSVVVRREPTVASDSLLPAQ
jgi:uncharacterized RDD family membrane protein YckC